MYLQSLNNLSNILRNIIHRVELIIQSNACIVLYVKKLRTFLDCVLFIEIDKNVIFFKMHKLQRSFYVLTSYGFVYIYIFINIYQA